MSSKTAESNLNVMLRGRSATDAKHAAQTVENVAADKAKEHKTTENRLRFEKNKKKKDYAPCILGVTGTVASAPTALRPKPSPKEKYVLPKRPKLSKKEHKPKDEVEKDAVIKVEVKIRSDKSSGSTRTLLSSSTSRPESSSTVKSTKQLVEEAKQISAAKTVFPTGRKSVGFSSSRRSSRLSKQIEREEAQESTARSVDEIIASLKTGSRRQATQADQRIAELMKSLLPDEEDYFTMPEKDDLVDLPEDDGGEEIVDKSESDSTSLVETALDNYDTDVLTEGNVDKVTDSDTSAPELNPDDEIVSKNQEIEPGPTSGTDLNKYWEDLNLSAEVNYEDVIGIVGEKLPVNLTSPRLEARPSPVSSQCESPSAALKPGAASETVQLASWQRISDFEKKLPTSSAAVGLHHFCVVSNDLLPFDAAPAEIAWTHHVPDKIHASEFVSPYRRLRTPELSTRPGTITTTKGTVVSRHVINDQSTAAAAERIMQEAYQIADEFQRVERLKTVTDEMMLSNGIAGSNLAMQPHSQSRIFWSVCPPKLQLNPGLVQSAIFPEYHGAVLGIEANPPESLYHSSDDESETDFASLHTKNAAIVADWFDEHYQTLYRRHDSDENIYYKSLEEQTKPAEPGDFVDREFSSSSAVQNAQSRLSKRISTASTKTAGGLSVQSISGISRFTSRTTAFHKRRVSLPDLSGEGDFLLIPQDFPSVLQEVDKQKGLIANMKKDLIETTQQIDPSPSPYSEQISRQQQSSLTQNTTSGTSSFGSRTLSASTAISSSHISSAHSRHDPKLLTKAERQLAAARKMAITYLPTKYLKEDYKNRPITSAHIQYVERQLEADGQLLSRAESVPKLRRRLEDEFRVPRKVRRRRRGSLPEVLSFSDFEKQKRRRGSETANTREWVRKIWEVWFDERIPPLEEEYRKMAVKPVKPNQDERTETEMSKLETHTEQSSLVEDKMMGRASAVNEILDNDLVLAENEEDCLATKKILQDEVDRLSRVIDDGTCSEFDVCRRGAIYRKLGRLKDAHTDLSRALEAEPNLVDALWHRHLVFLIWNQRAAALKDLDALLRISRTNAKAFKARAEIFRRSGDVTMAVVNYTHAIRLDPTDHESYCRRAEMHEKNDEPLLALEDYSMAAKLVPENTEAMQKHAMHYFEIGNWRNAIADFCEILSREPYNITVLLNRGRAYAKMSKYNEALQDFSAAIHLDPLSAAAFYYRGCLLRRALPFQAIRDFSTSLLLDSSEKNLQSLLHRGLVYAACGNSQDAIADFEHVLRLNRDIACAHVSIGLIYMQHLKDYDRVYVALAERPKIGYGGLCCFASFSAIKRFSNAIRADPTYIRAYVCRAETYSRTRQKNLALHDYTRAIHMRPDLHDLYIYRGQIVLELGRLDLAGFCIRQYIEISGYSNFDPNRHAAGIRDITNVSVVDSLSQQAVVLSFLQDYPKAIACIELAIQCAEMVCKQRPNASVFLLAGKVHMKAADFHKAIENFRLAINHLQPVGRLGVWPQEAAEANYLVGMCFLRLDGNLDALEYFTEALKINANFADAFYHRGICRMKLGHQKAILDFNRALALNPNLFSAYLTRAAYYGMLGRYSKAILNCNEALHLQPKSVRAFLYRGSLKYHIQAYGLAIEDLTCAIKADPTCGLAYFNRAVCYQESKRFSRALVDYGIILLIDSSLSYKVYINRGLLYFELRDYNNAMKDFAMACKSNPNVPTLLHSLALCYHKLRLLHKALITFTRLIGRNPGFLDAYVGRGNVLMDFGTTEGVSLAIRDYCRALRRKQDYLPARINLGYALQVSGSMQQAWNQFTSVISIQADYKPGLEGRAVVNLQMGNLFGALQDVTLAIRAGATAELYTNRGAIHQFMGDKQSAMLDYQRAIKHDSQYSLAYFNAANLYFVNRQFGQALSHYTKSIAHNSANESAYINRAITKALLRDAEGALSDFEEAIKRVPKAYHIYLNRGHLFMTLGKFTKAEADYSSALKLNPKDSALYKFRADARGKLGKSKLAVEDYETALQMYS